jgi:hypothetical protein
MPLFSRKKDTGVQSFVVALINQNCPALHDRLDGPRLEGRVNLTLPVLVVPAKGKKFAAEQGFAVTTKEFSSSGVAVVVDHACGPEEAAIGFRLRESVTWIRAKAKHVHPMGGGFFQIGYQLMERLHVGDHPELADFVF